MGIALNKCVRHVAPASTAFSAGSNPDKECPKDTTISLLLKYLIASTAPSNSGANDTISTLDKSSP